MPGYVVRLAYMVRGQRSGPWHHTRRTFPSSREAGAYGGRQIAAGKWGSFSVIVVPAPRRRRR